MRSSRLEYRLQQVMTEIDSPSLHPVSVHVARNESGAVANIVVVAFEPLVDPQERIVELRRKLEKRVGFPITIKVSLIEGQLIESAGVSDPDPVP